MASMKLRAAALLGVAAMTLTACGSNTAAPAESAPASTSTVTFTDNNGEHTINTPAKSVVATDNRTFETLESWDIKLTAGAVALMPDTISYAKDKNVVDLGSHREPNLEAIVEVAPDLIINGQRFTQHAEKISKLAPEATIVNLDPREGEPFDKELKRQTTVLGEIFGKQAEAKALTDEFDKSVARAKAAYNKDEKVMGLITSGGEINYSAPGSGRSVGPAFDILGLTPALVVEDSSTDHEGDDISVEAIAGSNPDWMLVLDRDGAVAADESGYTPAADLLKKSEALANVTASKEGNIVVMPADTYTNEGIQTYTEFFNDFADALESK
ncbi:siderophore ABC transporter substrate-binding protein [Glutamicibacter bergerei]|jgi:iron complex transport system substrate-binding protein|uniref:Siderophore ABC transporter substrate-binding protein n=2 Tax=Glutamicibacter TaxID=1742989 RepID=A0ABV9MN39_9MICC|nr:ABC transporter substrate-binding protein [Glutamicibacter ardleyensis]GGJ50831.1 iron ABC transporter substrate-binding protein [Glutamicibacter ardleyensis]HBV10156.1 iron ABC transporter substrate-binding protein [Micrococcaceae bacterium]